MLPTKMHRIECHEFGGPEVMRWVEADIPLPEASEILVKIAAAGVNRADLMQREGRYPPPPGSSDIIGMEMAGEVVAVGREVHTRKIGEKVFGLLSGGGYAEYVSVPEGQCLPVPDNISMIEAAGLTECIVTVWANVFEMAHLQPHETLLVHGGSSGIGTAAIQMSKIYGAKIFVTVGSDEKAEACRKLGADLAINYKTVDFVDVIQQQTSGQGVNVVLDMVGGDYVPRNLSILAPFGRHVSIATQRGRSITLDMRDVMQKRLTITGSTLRGRSATEKARLVADVGAKVIPWVVSCQFKPLISKVFPIKNAPDAHKMMESGAHIGKIVLEVQNVL